MKIGPLHGAAASARVFSEQLLTNVRHRGIRRQFIILHLPSQLSFDLERQREFTKMGIRFIPRSARIALTPSKPISPVSSSISRARNSARCLHQNARLPAVTAQNSRTRPVLQPLHQPSTMLRPSTLGGTRSIFIQTENTPNPDALKFLPNSPILPQGIATSFLEYLSPRSTLSPPHPSPLAANLMNIDGITSVFYGADFITVTKAADANWAHIKPEVFSLITEAVTSGQPIVNVTESKPGESGQEGGEEDSLAYNENDSEVVGMIKELLETRIRPAIQEDGGDIDFRGFEDGMVMLKLRGACRTCDSSTVTLKNGIEGMLMHYVGLAREVGERAHTDCLNRSRRSRELYK
jgi:Fe-S cluster biogenesis protein NfuA